MFLFRTGDRNNSNLNSAKINPVYILGVIVTSLLMTSCGDNKYSQCEQIFQIAHQVTKINQNISYTASEQPTQLKQWLEAADIMTKAAQQIKALHIDDTELIQYQNKFAKIYQTYSEATYDAVDARESRNIDALQTARDRAMAAGEIQKNLVEKINSYCIEQK
ncbi:MAG: hypothetical protein Tsb0014_41510 [Pleurocapsa sp.]